MRKRREQFKKDPAEGTRYLIKIGILNESGEVDPMYARGTDSHVPQGSPGGSQQLMPSFLPVYALGYHGCSKETAERLLAGDTKLAWSRNPYDWIGRFPVGN